MIVEAVEPETGKTIQIECAAKSEDEIRDLLAFDLSEVGLKKRIDSLAISADAKSLLFTIAKTTIKVGSMVVKIGRKILDIVATIFAEFPMASTGTIFGAVFGYLISSVPIIGLVFGPIIGPLAIALGFAMGALQDIENKALERRVRSAIAPVETLKAKV